MLRQGGRDTKKKERDAASGWPARKAWCDNARHAATPACDGTRTPRGQCTPLKLIGLRVGGTVPAAHAWSRVACSHDMAGTLDTTATDGRTRTAFRLYQRKGDTPAQES
jgi:hypothetical protein